jgi:hypothetical protein
MTVTPFYLPGGLDQKIVAAKIIKTVEAAKDFARLYGRQDCVLDVNARHTNTAVVRLSPTVAMSALPEHEGLLPRTTATGGYVEITLEPAKYFKVAVDELDIEPEKLAAEIGVAGGEAIVDEANTSWLTELVAHGTPQNLGETFGSGTTAAEIWAALVALDLPLQVAKFTKHTVLYIDPVPWARLLQAATLQTAVDPRVQAAILLGYEAVEVTPITGALAVQQHRACAAQAKRIIGVKRT